MGYTIFYACLKCHVCEEMDMDESEDWMMKHWGHYIIYVDPHHDESNLLSGDWGEEE